METILPFLNPIFQRIETNSKKPRRVVAALSGGVDSSVAAWILKEVGIEVIGITLRLKTCAEDPKEIQRSCCGIEDGIHAQSIARNLGISHYFLDYQEEFRSKVLEHAWNEYANGRTPNPCVLCNRFLKFGNLVAYARQIGAEGIVTGHYARIEVEQDGGVGLFRGLDPRKDQSYFLFGIDREVLPFCWFPLGSLRKTEVRLIAKHLRFNNAEKRESQDACFGIPGEAFAGTLKRVLGKVSTEGNFIDASGTVLGIHRGVHHYTLGQRRGLGIALGKRAYVSQIDPHSGNIVLSTDEESLHSHSFEAAEVNWMQPSFSQGSFRAEVQVRYTQKPLWARVTPLAHNRIRVEFDQGVRAVTPGQAAVVYLGEQLICGGWISTPTFLKDPKADGRFLSQ